MKEKDIEKYISIFNKGQKLLSELNEVRLDIVSMNIDEEAEYRNVKLSFWKHICSKYDKNKLLNCYGDVFFIEERNSGAYIARRVLWGLGLSQERYIIYEIISETSDGEYDYTDYEVEVLGEA